MISKPRIFDHGVAWEEGNSVTQGYRVGNTIYISGQFSHDKEGFVDGDIEAQTRLTFKNLDRVLEGFGVTKKNLAYVEIYLTRAEEHFSQCCAIWKEYLEGHRPAGTLLGVTYLASAEQLIEVSAVAHTD